MQTLNARLMAARKVKAEKRNARTAVSTAFLRNAREREASESEGSEEEGELGGSPGGRKRPREAEGVAEAWTAEEDASLLAGVLAFLRTGVRHVDWDWVHHRVSATSPTRTRHVIAIRYSKLCSGEVDVEGDRAAARWKAQSWTAEEDQAILRATASVRAFRVYWGQVVALVAPAVAARGAHALKRRWAERLEASSAVRAQVCAALGLAAPGAQGAAPLAPAAQPQPAPRALRATPFHLLHDLARGGHIPMDTLRVLWEATVAAQAALA